MGKNLLFWRKDVKCKDKEVQNLIKRWTRPIGFKFKDFATFLECVEIQIPVKLSIDNSKENTFTCISNDGREYSIYLLLGDGHEFYSGIYLTEGNQTKSYLCTCKSTEQPKPTVICEAVFKCNDKAVKELIEKWTKQIEFEFEAFATVLKLLEIQTPANLSIINANKNTLNCISADGKEYSIYLPLEEHFNSYNLICIKDGNEITSSSFERATHIPPYLKRFREYLAFKKNRNFEYRWSDFHKYYSEN